MTRDTRTISAVLLVALVVLSSGTAVTLATTGETGSATGANAASVQAEDATANVTIDDQRSDGEHIVVSSVTMSKGGFVVIHDASLQDGDAVGSVVGTSTYLEAGTHENVTITLARPINESQTLIAMPHLDSNDNEVNGFAIADGQVDPPYTEDGEAVTDDAEVTVGEKQAPTEGDGRQLPDQLVFRIEQLEIDEWSFVVGDETEPDRTETVSDVTLRDETVSVNVTELLSDPGTRDVVERVSSADERDAQMAANEAKNRTGGSISEDVPSDLDTVRVEVSDVTIENVTFVVELPPTLDVPAMPGIPEQPEGPEAPDANVTFENQTSDGETVTIDSVSTSEGGFVAVHDASLLDGNVVGSVVGTSSYLEPGTHEDVTVTLDEPLNESQTLIAVPYLDSNGNQMYDFVTSQGAEDLPYVVDDRAVVDPAFVEVSAEETTAPEETTTTETTTTEVEETTTTAETTVEETTAAEEETTTEEETTAEEETTTAEETTTPEETTTAEETATTTEDGGEVVSDLGPSFDVQNLEAPLNATIGDTLTVNATITNPTDSELTQSVDFRLEGTVLQRQNLTLGAGESQEVTFEIDTSSVDPGTYTHGVYTHNFGELAAITLEPAEAANETTTAEGTTTAEETTTVANETTEAETTVEETTTAVGTTPEETTAAANETAAAADETTTAAADETTAAAGTTVADGTTAAADETTTAEDDSGTTTAA